MANLTNELIIPIVEEEAEIGKVVREIGRVKVTRSVIESQVTCDEPSTYEEYEVVRVPLNRVVEQTEALRVENGTTIIPVYEEEVVVLKRLILREEIHLVKKIRQEHSPVNLTLRKHKLAVDRTRE